MRKDAVIKLADYNKKSKSWTPMDMVQDLIKEPVSDRFNKAIIIFLDDAEGGYDIWTAVAGMDRRDLISLLEATKLMHLKTLIGGQEG